MSRYDRDPRVQRQGDFRVLVESPDDRFEVYADRPDEWFAAPLIGGASYQAASPSTRDEANGWADRTTAGPFGSADEAISVLIGDPR